MDVVHLSRDLLQIPSIATIDFDSARVQLFLTAVAEQEARQTSYLSPLW